MATIINNPPSDNSSGPIGIILVIIVLIVLGYLGVVYGLPAIQHVQVGTPTINVPGEIDVNVNQTK